MENILSIRAHHLLCMQGYQGHGYSSGFENHIHKIIVQLKGSSEQKLRVVVGSDAICAKCPNLVNDRCQKDDDSDNRIRNIDLCVLHMVEIQAGSVDTFSKYLDAVNKKLTQQSQLVGICDCCQWANKCLWYLSLDSIKE